MQAANGFIVWLLFCQPRLDHRMDPPTQTQTHTQIIQSEIITRSSAQYIESVTKAKRTRYKGRKLGDISFIHYLLLLKPFN